MRPLEQTCTKFTFNVLSVQTQRPTKLGLDFETCHVTISKVERGSTKPNHDRSFIFSSCILLERGDGTDPEPEDAPPKLTLTFGGVNAYVKSFQFENRATLGQFCDLLRAGLVLGFSAVDLYRKKAPQAFLPFVLALAAQQREEFQLQGVEMLLPGEAAFSMRMTAGSGERSCSHYASRLRPRVNATAEENKLEQPVDRKKDKKKHKDTKAEPLQPAPLEEPLSRGMFVLTTYRIRYVEYSAGDIHGHRDQCFGGWDLSSDPRESLERPNSCNGSCDVACAMIKKIEHKGDQLRIHCKNFRTLVFTFFESKAWVDQLVVRLNSAAFPGYQQGLFAFTYGKPSNWTDDTEESLVAPPKSENGWLFTNMVSEYKRLGLLQHDAFRLLKNAQFSISPTYPEYFIIPKSVTNQELEQVCGYRSRARIPVTTWIHPRTSASLSRCSQPLTGMGSKQCREDQALLQKLRASAMNTSSLSIIDARPYKNAAGQKMMGKGYEVMEYYDHCTLQFMGIENIHVIRNALEKLVELCEGSGSIHEAAFLTKLEQSKWLFYNRLLLQASAQMASILEDEGRAVVVHCSDGWDRTAQLSALCQLLLDPYYRTFVGFAYLVEKEWTTMGYKFAERCGHADNRHDNSQRSPVFLQFLDCVWQLTRQFPMSFEFNSQYLVDLYDQTMNCRFGTFLYDNEEERAQPSKHADWGKSQREKSRSAALELLRQIAEEPKSDLWTVDQLLAAFDSILAEFKLKHPVTTKASDEEGRANELRLWFDKHSAKILEKGDSILRPIQDTGLPSTSSYPDVHNTTISIWTYLFRPKIMARYQNANYMPCEEKLPAPQFQNQKSSPIVRAGERHLRAKSISPEPEAKETKTNDPLPSFSALASPRAARPFSTPDPASLSPRRLHPSCTSARIVLWEDFFCRWSWDWGHKQPPPAQAATDIRVAQLAAKVDELQAQLAALRGEPAPASILKVQSLTPWQVTFAHARKSSDVSLGFPPKQQEDVSVRVPPPPPPKEESSSFSSA